MGVYVIGLTGNIAAGKSTVASMLAGLGAAVIDADALAHQAMRAGTPTWQRVVDEFGVGILGPDNEINRARLGDLVFGDAEALRRLEAIVHPEVIADSEALLQQHQREATSSSSAAVRVVVLEAIKLIEAGMHERCDELWVVRCSREQQVERLQEARGLSVAEANVRINSQPRLEEKLALADVVIDNSGNRSETRAQVVTEWERILRKERERGLAGAQTEAGGTTTVWQSFVEEHPLLSMWAVLAVGMVLIFLVTSRDVDLLWSQRLFMALACVATAGLCAWIIHWE